MPSCLLSVVVGTAQSPPRYSGGKPGGAFGTRRSGGIAFGVGCWTFGGGAAAAAAGCCGTCCSLASGGSVSLRAHVPFACVHCALDELTDELAEVLKVFTVPSWSCGRTAFCNSLVACANCGGVVRGGKDIVKSAGVLATLYQICFGGKWKARHL